MEKTAAYPVEAISFPENPVRQLNGKELQRTYLIFILWFLVLHEQLQPFFTDRRLYTTTTTVPFLRFFGFASFCFILGFIGLANHLRLTERPHNGHPRFWVTNMANAVREIGVRLCVPQHYSGEDKMSVIHWQGAIRGEQWDKTQNWG